VFVQVRGYDGAVGATGAGPPEGLVVSEWSVAVGGADDGALPSDDAMTER